MKIYLKICTCIVLSIFFSCSSKQNYLLKDRHLSDYKSGNVAIAPVRNLSDIFKYKSKKDAYYKNAFIGVIYFSGGLVKVKGDTGVQISTKNIKLVKSEKMLNTVKNWYLDTIQKAFKEATLMKDFDLAKLPKYQIIENFEIVEKDGVDNINLPRLNYKPDDKLSNELLFKLKSVKPQMKYFVVPTVAAYYSHTAGWFLGHDWGNDAGIRIGVLLTVYDLEKNKMIFHFENWNSKFFPRKYAVNSNMNLHALHKIREKSAEELHIIVKDQLHFIKN